MVYLQWCCIVVIPSVFHRQQGNTLLFVSTLGFYLYRGVLHVVLQDRDAARQIGRAERVHHVEPLENTRNVRVQHANQGDDRGGGGGGGRHVWYVMYDRRRSGRAYLDA